MIAVIDYNAGNLTSVLAALKNLKLEAQITNDPEVIRNADRIIFPGVGAAGKAMENLKELNLIPVLKEVIESGKPFLGICLGYQILFDSSEENNVNCLGFLPGKVQHFGQGIVDDNGKRLKVPHMGWNNVSCTIPNHPLWEGIEDDSQFYFVHSFFVNPSETSLNTFTTDYSRKFSSGTIKGNIAGVQFHPEKSGEVGLKLISNFANWQP